MCCVLVGSCDLDGLPSGRGLYIAHDMRRSTVIPMVCSATSSYARGGRLRSSEMTAATITLTHLGDLGVETVYGIIDPPQIALVGFRNLTEQPWAGNGMSASSFVWPALWYILLTSCPGQRVHDRDTLSLHIHEARRG